ncbi:MAG TPA: TonB-dependent receptor [Allosphingosinicella sp.]|uniref:TonB-dependent receptor n=1 Tax=Allosphingosinicella sp. TaxID=2823234 RepID=UPI002ED9E237
MKSFALLFATTALAATPAYAQQTAPAEETGDHVHGQSGEIVVTAPFVRDLDLLAGTSVLAGENLVREIRPQLGDTLARLPGVSATSFSPGASRPVLRGFSGERVRVLTDGLGSLDASNTSADHAVTIDPLTAERIEVLKGPAVLLFGSQAIGGAVNVLDRRIPRVVPDEALHVDALAVLGSAADERSVGAGVDAPLGGGLVFHVDGSYRKTDDLRAGGYILSPDLRAEQLEIAEEEAAEGHVEEAEEALELADLRGEIPNSQTEQTTYGAGLAYIRDGGNIGFSVSKFDSRYGVPMRPGAEHHHEEDPGHEEEHGEEDVSIDLNQVRADLRGELNFAGGAFEKVRGRFGYADYEHTEFEGDEVGTVFTTEGFEGRVELVQREREGWRGASGVQYFTRDFAAVGAEAFLPPNETSQLGLFTLQEFNVGQVNLEAAARYERTEVGSDTVGVDRKFNTFSAAFGASYDIAPGVKLGANVSRAERAPSAEELFSDGPHIATQAFEIGDPTLNTEKGWGGEIFARADAGPFELSASLFATKFDDFIYEAATGEEEDELPVFQYFQRDATYWGFEASASARLFEAGGFRFVADGVADYVRGTIEDAGPVPRIPPLRLLGGIEAQSDRLDLRGEVEWVDEQDRVASFETPTEGFTLVNASAAWRPWGKRNPTSIVLSANNIFDVDARRHASFTKGYVPLAGRDIRLSARVSF